jgi:hypothetical protein
MTDHPTAPPRWRISSYSTNGGSCVEIADLGEHVAVRNSNHPDAGTLTLSASAMRAFIDTCRSGHHDDLAR